MDEIFDILQKICSMLEEDKFHIRKNLQGDLFDEYSKIIEREINILNEIKKDLLKSGGISI